MGLFRKELSDYKVMEKYKKSLDDFYIFGETEKYRLYLDKPLNQYIMRQDKQNPKQVVYLGWLRGEKCVFHGRIFYINKWSYTGRSENPLNYIDVETGNAGHLSVLSNKGCWIAMHWHCQDNVNNFTIKDDKIVIEVTRYKADAHNEKEFSYVIYVTYDKGQFKIEHMFPEEYISVELKTKKQQVKVGDVITVNILDPLGGLSPEEFYLYGNDGDNDVRKEQWILKQDLFEPYKQFADENSGELYVVIYYEEGNKKQICVPKEKWEYGRRKYYNS